MDDFNYDIPVDHAIMKQIRSFGQKCNSVCCTGAFIVETMLCVLLNEDVREIRFDNIKSDKFWSNKKHLKKYVPFQVPAILAHYAMATEGMGPYIKELHEGLVKTPKLERFIIKNLDISARTYAMKNSMFEVLTMYDETLLYLELPGNCGLFIK